MSSTLGSRVGAWRDRLLARWRSPSRALPRSPYRVAAPPPRVHPARPSPLRASLTALRCLWSPERLRWIAAAATLGVCSTACFVLLERSARAAAPHVPTPVTHLLALPFGLVVGLIAAVVFLAFGAAVMALGAMLLISIVHAVVGLARSAWTLLVVLPREFFARDGGG